MNKKGFIFVISATIMVSVLFIVFLTLDRYSYSDSTQADQRRLTFANDFVQGFNQDLERAIRIASFRSLIALEENIALTGQFLNNTEESFAEIVYNGSINGVPAELMENSSIKEYIRRVNIIGERFGLETNVEVSEIILSQSDPWFVDVVVVANVSILDKAELASWDFFNNYTSEVPIDNLRDPLYAVFTQNRFYNTVRPFPLVLGEGDPIFNLESLIGSSYYIESPYAPSFIQRFSNDAAASPAGIESLVNIQLISDQNVPVYEDQIKIDYIYFNDLDTEDICEFEDIGDYYLLLPSNRLSLYDSEELATCS